jgi:hypothetical protein
MDFSSFKACVAGESVPVILLEGTRVVPLADAAALTALGRFLAQQLPQARFRSGNAEGSDTLFARGVESIDPARMELIVPTAGHRRKNRHSANPVTSLDAIALDHEEALATFSGKATPKNQGLINQRHRVPRLGSKARYLLRDTLKVVGDQSIGLPPATLGIFYTQPDTMAGGTGHTIRVCEQQGVPVVLQSVWMSWLSVKHEPESGI